MSNSIECAAVVGEDLHGARFDAAAAALFPDYSRSRLQTWIRSGELTLDGKPCRPREKVVAGSQLQLNAQPLPAVDWQPEALGLDISYADDSLLVINKPAGLVVHPAAGHPGGTLVNALLHHDARLAELPRSGIVHRLDKDTSGLLVVARTLTAHHRLVAQLQAREVKREYLAVCHGVMTGGGTVDAPMGRHPRQRKKMAVVVSGGKPAVTHYRVEERFGHHTSVEVNLETGRTHQIRVHLSHRKHPLIGDPVYGGRLRLPPAAPPSLVTTLQGFRRQALHARALGFAHPLSGEWLQLHCDLPADLVALLEALRRDDPSR